MEFRIGNRVKGYNGTGVIVGTHKWTSDSFLIEHDTWIGGHDGHRDTSEDVTIARNKGWYYGAHQLELISVGDTLFTSRKALRKSIISKISDGV